MRQARLIFLSAAASAAVAFVFCGSALAQGTLPGDAGRGEKLAHQWCSSCHLITGEKRAGDMAPPFRAIARDPKMGPNEWRALLSRPHASMPPITLSRQETEDLVAYLELMKEQ